MRDIVNEKISMIKHEGFINFHSIIEAGGYTYAIFEELAHAQADLDRKITEQAAHPENYDSTHLQWTSASTRELNIGDVYQPHTIFQHGIDDGHHNSDQKALPSARRPIKRNLIVNI